MDVTVFSAAGCGKCVATKAALRTKGIPFTEVRLDLFADAAEHVRELLGRVTMPIVMAFRTEDDEVPDLITDFHPDLLTALLDPERPIPEAV